MVVVSQRRHSLGHPLPTVCGRERGGPLSKILSNGLVIGAIYGLVALGITLVYKKSGVLNFAHGEVGMVGAFVFYVCSVEQRLPYLLAAAGGVATSALLGCA